MKRLFAPFFLFCVYTFALAQKAHTTIIPNLNNSDLPIYNITIHQDCRIERFVKDLQIMQIRNNFPTQVQVYQVQVISTKNRLDAMRIKKDLESIIEKMHNEIIFKEPYYKFRIGFFRTKPEAELYRQKVDNFLFNKKAVIIIPTMIDTDDYIARFLQTK